MQVERFIVPAGDTYVIQTGALDSGELLVGTFEVAGGRDLDFELRDPDGRSVEQQLEVTGPAYFSVKIVTPGPYTLRFGNMRARGRFRAVALRMQGYADAEAPGGRQE